MGIKAATSTSFSGGAAPPTVWAQTLALEPLPTAE
jgi:hypothetical protein